MNKKLFVAGLSYDLSDEQLSEHFAQFGTVVSAQIITDRMTGRSKGFGFVEMETDEQAQKAISELNETEFAGRKIVVNEARPQEPRPSNQGGGFSNRRNDRDRGSRDNKRQNRW